LQDSNLDDEKDAKVLDEDEKVFPKTFAQNDKFACFLKEMYTNLSTLPWQRVDVLARPVFAHTDIIAKSFFEAGKSTVEYLAGCLDY